MYGRVQEESKKKYVHREVLGLQDTTKRKDREKRKTSAKKQGERGRTRRYIRSIRGVKRKYRNEKIIARPRRLRENAETAISGRGPGSATKNKGLYQ